ncbi:hypothetical protein [Fulvivirga sp.]|uniref:hypothetical protein n=1 Tax=Fulvivirga sp. TaxID=1931237 RepID=UPI0032EB36F2
MAENVSIYISKQSDNDGLYLSDSEGHQGDNTITTVVSPGDIVTWSLVANGGVYQITAITDEVSNNLFVSNPAPTDPSNPQSSWTGTIKSDASGSESYSISYRLSAGGTVYTDDPKLKVNT